MENSKFCILYFLCLPFGSNNKQRNKHLIYVFETCLGLATNSHIGLPVAPSQVSKMPQNQTIVHILSLLRPLGR